MGVLDNVLDLLRRLLLRPRGLLSRLQLGEEDRLRRALTALGHVELLLLLRGTQLRVVLEQLSQLLQLLAGQWLILLLLLHWRWGDNSFQIQPLMLQLGLLLGRHHGHGRHANVSLLLLKR